MGYQIFFIFKQISLLYHYFFIIMENRSNENLMENQNICSNSIKNTKMIIAIAFQQIDLNSRAVRIRGVRLFKINVLSNIFWFIRLFGVPSKSQPKLIHFHYIILCHVTTKECLFTFYCWTFFFRNNSKNVYFSDDLYKAGHLYKSRVWVIEAGNRYHYQPDSTWHCCCCYFCRTVLFCYTFLFKKRRR